ncbi:MAG: glycerol-3-phosphate dehydrogenase/oxidase [Planctomycetes bacterium]|nr:glycerol-3-phosphate dehydrogenase/oxidase [Planctomycetota bacterium]
MRADLQSLHDRVFDLLVVGGGIQGAAIAREAAVRGLDVLLVERDDFACGTSMRSSRLVHGGVRYLQQGRIGLVREALAERERLLRSAPHLVRPQPMLMPFFDDGGGMHRWLVRAGLRTYSWLARGSTMPAPRHHDAASCIRMFPGLRRRGLHGGSVFYDARTEDARLTIAVLEAAAEAGAALCNHVELTGLGSHGGLVLRDRILGDELVVRPRQVVNAAGPKVDAVREALGVDAEPLVRLSRGSHLVLDPRESEMALAAFLPDDRIQFVIPHPDGTLCGTTEVDEAAGDAHGAPPEADVDYILAALQHLLESPVDRGAVRFAYAGWRALPARRGPAGGLGREAFTVGESVPGADCTMHTVVGGKLTTHRSFAERVVAQLFGRRGPSPTRDQHLPGGKGPHDVSDPLWWRHGGRAGAVRALADEDPSWSDPIAPSRDLLFVEAVFALRHLGVVTFEDLVIRRLFHSMGPCLDEDVLRRLHDVYLQERLLEFDSSFEHDRDRVIAAVRELAGDSVGLGSPSASSR